MINTFNTFLNQEQQKVIEPKNGILLVTAGAGSGKTRVITARVASLIINYNINPESILALTFTNKAAKEMKDRIRLFLKDNSATLPYVGTFHAYCLKILKSSPYFRDFSNFSLINEDDALKIIRNLIQKNKLEKQIAPKQILSFISRIKNESINPTDSEEFWSSNNLFKEIFYLYQEEKKLSYYLDFDDLLLTVYSLFEKHLDFKYQFQNSIRHVLVDEYQDTNKVQHALLKAITLDNNLSFAIDSLCVVGDEDQSIYSWRGATVSNILNFKNDYPDAISITLEQNYRSVEPILESANNIIRNNLSRNTKILWSDRKATDRLRLVSCTSSFQEAQAISLFLKEANNLFSAQPGAILYRSHFQSRAIEEALIRASIPYKIIGGIQFYDRQEIKDMLSYLRLIINPFDRIALSRIINIPSRNLGQKFEELFFKTWDEQIFLNFKEISQYLLNNNYLTETKNTQLSNFIKIFDKLSSETMASKALDQIIEKTSYFNYLDQNFEKEEARSKKENIKELINGALYFEKNNNQALNKFLEEVALLQELISSDESDNKQVYLMTFHAAKGLEFDNIAIAGLEDGILPSNHSLYNSELLEEERRLLYVGITRARERVLITNANYRTVYGQLTNQRPSRFITELPELYIKSQDCSRWAPENFKYYFQNWLDNKKPENFKNIKNNNLDNNLGGLKTHQAVGHKTFGQGIIQKIDKSGSTTYVTVKFKEGLKKLDSKFIKII